MFRTIAVLCSALLLVITEPVWRVAVADDDAEASLSTQESEETTRLIRAELPKWKLWSGADGEHELTLNPKSVLRWTNPEVARVYGDVYLWTRDGRPEALISFYKGWKPNWPFTAEMHSLSLEPVTGKREGAVVWRPTKPGVEFQDIPDAPRPAESAPRRLQQMRTLAGQFSAQLMDERRNRAGERQELRLLTQPLYRYPTGEHAVLDGGLFAIAMGTDPEVFLLIEARRASEKVTWQYGFARMNVDAMTVNFKEQEVWRAEKRKGWAGPPDASYRVLSLPETIGTKSE